MGAVNRRLPHFAGGRDLDAHPAPCPNFRWLVAGRSLLFLKAR